MIKMTNIGIYKITNQTNGKVYIGQSVEINKRFIRHRMNLKKNIHDNCYLQSSYNKHGKELFVYEIVEYCEESKLNERENFWILHYNSHDRRYGYNFTIPNPNGDGYRRSEETIKKISKKLKKYSKEELISYLQEYYYHYGKVPTTRDIANNPDIPSPIIYKKNFGSFKQALTEAGLYEFSEHKHLFGRKDYSKGEILQLFIDFINKNNRFPNYKEIRKSKDCNLPSTTAIDRYFNGITEIREILNHVNSHKNREKEEALEGLRKLYEQEGRINSNLINGSLLTRTASYYNLNFGSLINAYELAGVTDYKIPNNRIKELQNNKRQSS